MRPIFLSNPFIQLKNHPYKIARKQLKMSIDHFHSFFFFENCPLAVSSSHHPASKTPCLTMLYHNIAWRIFEDWSLEILIWNTIDIYTASNDHTKFSTAVQLYAYMYPDTIFSTHSNMQIPL